MLLLFSVLPFFCTPDGASPFHVDEFAGKRRVLLDKERDLLTKQAALESRRGEVGPTPRLRNSSVRKRMPCRRS
jgi:hypothetical protein